MTFKELVGIKEAENKELFKTMVRGEYKGTLLAKTAARLYNNRKQDIIKAKRWLELCGTTSEN